MLQISSKFLFSTLLSILSVCAISYGQDSKSVTDYLTIGKKVSFDKASYFLTWTSHPTENFYKQEYLGKGDDINKFKKLVMFDFITGDLKAEDLVAEKIAALEKLKKTNPVVNYSKYERDGEIMLDFLISENTPDGKYVVIVERNMYRYRQVTDTNGVKGVLLFAVAERSYGDDIDKFFPWLKKHNMDMVNAVGTYELPQILVSK